MDHNDKAKSRKEKPLMFIRDLKDCAEFIAGDNSILREILHPDKADLTLRYSLAHAIVRPDQTTKPHRLKTSEVYYIVAGEGEMHIDGETGTVRPGSTVYIPPSKIQFIRNSGKTDLVFLCIVDPAWRKEDEEILQQS
jgi:mannose-6-phosphate isomerase-like protein (cupin superfamily)